MKPKTLMLMGVAIVCGLVASYMTSRLIAEKNETVKVLVAKGPLTQWQPVRNPEQMFGEKEVPKNQVPPTYVPPTALKELENRPLIKNMRKDDIVTWEALQDPKKAGMESQLKKGMRAFAIETSARTAAGGFVLPGTRVDIILVKRGQVASEASYVEENLLVKAVDLMPTRPEDRPGVVPSTITLEVTPEQALKLAKAKQGGEFTLTLRPFGDEKKYSDSVAVAPPPPPPIPEPTVEDMGDPETPKEKPKVLVRYQRAFDGAKWHQWRVELSLDGKRVLKRERAPLEADGSDGDAAPPTTAPSAKPDNNETQLPTPEVSN